MFLASELKKAMTKPVSESLWENQKADDNSSSSSDRSVKKLPQWLIEATDVIIPAYNEKSTSSKKPPPKTTIQLKKFAQNHPEEKKIPYHIQRTTFGHKKVQSESNFMKAQQEDLPSTERGLAHKTLDFRIQKPLISQPQTPQKTIDPDLGLQYSQIGSNSLSIKGKSKFLVKHKNQFKSHWSINELSSGPVHKKVTSTIEENQIPSTSMKKSKKNFQDDKLPIAALEDTLKRPSLDLQGLKKGSSKLMTTLKASSSTNSSPWLSKKNPNKSPDNLESRITSHNETPIHIQSPIKDGFKFLTMKQQKIPEFFTSQFKKGSSYLK